MTTFSISKVHPGRHDGAGWFSVSIFMRKTPFSLVKESFPGFVCSFLFQLFLVSRYGGYESSDVLRRIRSCGCVTKSICRISSPVCEPTRFDSYELFCQVQVQQTPFVVRIPKSNIMPCMQVQQALKMFKMIPHELNAEQQING